MLLDYPQFLGFYHLDLCRCPHLDPYQHLYLDPCWDPQLGLHLDPLRDLCLVPHLALNEDLHLDLHRVLRLGLDPYHLP